MPSRNSAGARQRLFYRDGTFYSGQYRSADGTSWERNPDPRSIEELELVATPRLSLKHANRGVLYSPDRRDWWEYPCNQITSLKSVVYHRGQVLLFGQEGSGSGAAPQLERMTFTDLQPVDPVLESTDPLEPRAFRLQWRVRNGGIDLFEAYRPVVQQARLERAAAGTPGERVALSETEIFVELDPGESVSAEVDGVLPEDPAGWEIVVEVDPANLVPELNERNNSLRLPLNAYADATEAALVGGLQYGTVLVEADGERRLLVSGDRAIRVPAGESSSSGRSRPVARSSRTGRAIARGPIRSCAVPDGAGRSKACLRPGVRRMGQAGGAMNSPCLDRGDPVADFSREPVPNGGALNQGAYGNTPEASKSARRASRWEVSSGQATAERAARGFVEDEPAQDG